VKKKWKKKKKTGSEKKTRGKKKSLWGAGGAFSKGKRNMARVLGGGPGIEKLKGFEKS